MHKAWLSIEEFPFCFSMSSVKFQGHMGQKSPILTRFEFFWLQLQFEFTNGFAMMHKA